MLIWHIVHSVYKAEVIMNDITLKNNDKKQKKLF